MITVHVRLMDVCTCVCGRGMCMYWQCVCVCVCVCVRETSVRGIDVSRRCYRCVTSKVQCSSPRHDMTPALRGAARRVVVHLSLYMFKCVWWSVERMVKPQHALYSRYGFVFRLLGNGKPRSRRCFKAPREGSHYGPRMSRSLPPLAPNDTHSPSDGKSYLKRSHRRRMTLPSSRAPPPPPLPPTTRPSSRAAAPAPRPARTAPSSVHRSSLRRPMVTHTPLLRTMTSSTSTRQLR